MEAAPNGRGGPTARPPHRAGAGAGAGAGSGTVGAGADYGAGAGTEGVAALVAGRQAGAGIRCIPTDPPPKSSLLRQAATGSGAEVVARLAQAPPRSARGVSSCTRRGGRPPPQRRGLRMVVQEECT